MVQFLPADMEDSPFAGEDMEDAPFCPEVAVAIDQFTSYQQWLTHSGTPPQTAEEGYYNAWLRWEHLKSDRLRDSTCITNPGWVMHKVLHLIASGEYPDANTDDLHPRYWPLALAGAEVDLRAGLESTMILFNILWRMELCLSSAMAEINKIISDVETGSM